MLYAIFWAIFIFIATCTNDVHALLHDAKFSFTFTWTPNWQAFQFFYPINQISQFEMVSHFFLFFVFTLILADTSIRFRHTILIAVIYALFTEYLQLHFYRGAEIYDMIANLSGIFAAAIFVWLGRLILRKGKSMWNRAA